MIYKVNSKTRENLYKFFEGMSDTSIFSCLQGHMGEAWVDDLNNPAMAELVIGDFVFFGGVPKGEEAEELLLNIPPNSLIISESSEWKRLIENFYGKYLSKVTRYSFLKYKDHLDVDYLKGLIKKLPDEYELRKASKELLEQYSIEEVSEDFTSNFNSIDDYLNRGIGYFIIKDNKVVSGASSYSIYDGGIEIEIDTKKDYRNKGLAKIVAAALILDCLEGGIYPSWDAANLISKSLAEKLGYKLNGEYETYHIIYTN